MVRHNPFRPGDIVYVGNQDNLGFSFIQYCTDRNIPAWLLISKRGINRSDPDFYSPGLFDKYASRIMKGKQFVDSLQLLYKSRGLHIFSTGIEIMHMLQYSTPYNSYYIIPTGSDLSNWPFVQPSTALIKNYLLYKDIFFDRMAMITRIYTSQLDCLYAARALGLHNKLKSWVYPSPISYIDSAPGIKVAASRDIKTIFFLPSRKNGDSRYTSDKGPQLIINAIEKFALDSSEDTLNSSFFLNVCNGNTGKLTYTFHNFQSDLDLLKEKYSLNVLHLRNLSAIEYWGILRDPRIIVIDQFGQFHGHMGGIGREACVSGRPVVTGCLDTNDRSTRLLYGSQSPILTAFSGTEICNHMKWFSELTPHKRKVLSKRIREWALNIFNPDRAFKSILDDIRNSESFSAS